MNPAQHHPACGYKPEHCDQGLCYAYSLGWIDDSIPPRSTKRGEIEWNKWSVNDRTHYVIDWYEYAKSTAMR